MDGILLFDGNIELYRHTVICDVSCYVLCLDMYIKGLK